MINLLIFFKLHIFFNSLTYAPNKVTTAHFITWMPFSCTIYFSFIPLPQPIYYKY